MKTALYIFVSLAIAHSTMANKVWRLVDRSYLNSSLSGNVFSGTLEQLVNLPNFLSGDTIYHESNYRSAGNGNINP